MKKKVTKTIIIVLATLLIILIANIIVGIHSNSSVNATEYCPYCGMSTILYEINYRNNSQHWTRCCWNCSRLLNAEAHQCGNIIKQDAKYHYRKCSDCEGEIYESHSGGTHTNQGKCTVCGEQYQTHSTTKKGEPTGVGSHKEVYSCTYSGCTWKQDGATVSCSGGTHANQGKCTVCGEQYQTHSTTKKCDPTGLGSHIEVYTCTYSGCTWKQNGATVSCSGGTHANGGKCTECKRTYQTHTMEDMGYKKTGTASHVKIFECTYQGCYEQSTENEGECTGGTHQNDGICQTCFFQYQTHGQSSNILRYTKTEEQHRAIYKCLCTECGITYSGAGNEHTVQQWKDNENGTHTGKCTVCSYEKTLEHIYEDGKCNECGAMKPENESCEHIYVDKNDNTQHWEECSECNQIKEESLETHTIENYIDNENGTHTEKCAKCTYEGTVEHTYDESGQCICGATLESEENIECTHSYTKKNNETKHWEECTLCQDKQKEENHKGATHENGGKCEVCGITYEQHQQSTKIKDYKKTSTGHTPNYECTFKGCTVKYSGQEADHEYGTCTNQEDGTHLAICSVCTQEIREEHVYENGRCDKCSAVEPEAGTNTECIHSYEKRNNEIQHWEVCTKCKEVKTGSLEEHTISNYADNKNGTHTGKCSVCDYEKTEQHNYENNKCVNCNSEKPAEKCEHTYTTYVDNGDETHSAECTKCKAKITEVHNYESGKCIKCNAVDPSYNAGNGSENNNNNNDNGNINNNNGDTNNNINNDTNNGNKDNSTSQNGIPKAGFNGGIIVAIVAIGTVLLLLAIKMKKYKDI